MEDGVQVDNRHLDVQLFECHDLTCAHALVTRRNTHKINFNFLKLKKFIGIEF
jgi:hypothetical protein